MYIQLICAKDVTISTQEPLSYASIVIVPHKLT